MKISRGFRPILCAGLLLFCDPSLARPVRIKEDPTARNTTFRMITPSAVENLTGDRLRNKVRLYRPILAPAERPVTKDWWVYAECDGNLSLDHQTLTAARAELQLDCGR